MIPAKPFYMIRHGETVANVDRILHGHTDSLLTDLGRDQARSVHKIIDALEVKPTVIVHSNLTRARDTATIINEILDIPMYEDAEWIEIFAGDSEGARYDECEGFLYGFEAPKNAESFSDFFKRIRQATKHTLDKYEGPVLIVTHGGVYRGLGGAYGLKSLEITDNCRLSEFQPNPEKAPFPWDVYGYEYNEKQNRVIRAPETMYDNCELFGDE